MAKLSDPVTVSGTGSQAISSACYSLPPPALILLAVEV